MPYLYFDIVNYRQNRNLPTEELSLIPNVQFFTNHFLEVTHLYFIRPSCFNTTVLYTFTVRWLLVSSVHIYSTCMEHFLSLPYAFKVRAFTVRGTLVSTVRIYSTVYAWNTHVILISYLYYSFYALMFVEPIFSLQQIFTFLPAAPKQQQNNKSWSKQRSSSNTTAQCWGSVRDYLVHCPTR